MCVRAMHGAPLYVSARAPVQQMFWSQQGVIILLRTLVPVEVSAILSRNKSSFSHHSKLKLISFTLTSSVSEDIDMGLF